MIGRIVVHMGTTIRIRGAVDRREPDPTAPSDQGRMFIGTLAVSWTVDMPSNASAAIVKIATGGGMTSKDWGPHVLCLRWIGEPPPAEVAQVVYDAVRDRGPEFGPMDMTVEATSLTAEQGSYRRIRKAS